jgi:hypothetical protein
MAEFRNDGGYPLVISDLAITVDPGEGFSWPGYDPQVNGVVPGCTWLDAPAAEPASGAGSASTPSGQPAASTPPAGGTPASGAGQPATSGKPKAEDPETDSGSKEN